MEESINPTINIGPVTFNLTIVVLTLLTVALIFGFIYWATRNMTLRPTGKQNVLEYLFDKGLFSLLFLFIPIYGHCK